MRDRLRGFDRVLDLHADPSELRQVRGVDRQADGLAVHDGVERAAERDVGADLTRADFHREPSVQHE